MKTHVRVAAAALIVFGVSACQQTTEGSVAMTTEPGPPLTSAPSRQPSSPTLPGLPNIPIPDIRIPGLPGPDVPEVPAPPNAATMSCSEYTGLDDATKLAVIRVIITNQGGRSGQEAEMVALLMADAMCQFMPNAEVNEVVIGIPGR
ncbi:hypothetical protein H7J88_28390 [Mycolicibacterium flavescens]|uniref:DUF732 domain-containing protein n=1 Tax=Mycolicibacterium flavescens TaxID=1776 RepID=A0A1E3RB63_MYCFV|nr:hypothetical protein [Mycolicibacterium flavescens]MCV7283560.1 hypothetical protein [Mycolicibacterium flavescens]ODQ87069.1 hypothetical protein BHQ18_25015 [Mycolicibacterium flavescens]